MPKRKSVDIEKLRKERCKVKSRPMRIGLIPKEESNFKHRKRSWNTYSDRGRGYYDSEPGEECCCDAAG